MHGAEKCLNAASFLHRRCSRQWGLPDRLFHRLAGRMRRAVNRRGSIPVCPQPSPRFRQRPCLMRVVSSCAALSVKVTTMICLGVTARSVRSETIRSTSVNVLPEPVTPSSTW